MILKLKYKQKNQDKTLMLAIESVQSSIGQVSLENNCCILSVNDETLSTALAQKLLENLEFFLLSDNMQEEAGEMVSLLHSLDYQYKG